ncbi:MAG: DUF4249 family protein [Algoriphagus aquaeductus]|uniref:DUF4249 family protein n=1 Tax=Algoriphagus aquaeductus TaxID=475299 RepID=UPI00391DCEBA
MKRLNQLSILCLFAWSTLSCVDEINLNLPNSNEILVVDAWVGNLTSDTYIRVYRARPFVSFSPSGSEPQVKLQELVVERKDGTLFPFQLLNETIYSPVRRFNLMEGEEYRLRFTTLEGKKFESSWEKVPPKVEPLDWNAKAFERQILVRTGTTSFFQPGTFADINLKIKDPGKGPIGYLIKTSGISEQFTTSERDNCECVCYLPDPNIFPGMNIRSNEAFEGKEIDLKVGEIPLSSLGRYLAMTEVITLTEFGQQYLSQVDLQQRNTGSIFDPAPFRIKGNIQSVDSEETVLGGFFLFQKTATEKLFFRTQIRNESRELNHYFEPLVMVGGTCRTYYTDALPTIPNSFRP